MAVKIGRPTPGSGVSVTLLPSTTAATAGTTANAATLTGLGWVRQACIALKLTNAAAAAGDKLDVYIDTSFDGGSTFVNAVHFTQILGNGADAITDTAVLDPGGAPGAVTVATTADAASGVVRPTVFGDQLRVRYAVTDAGALAATFTFSISAVLKGW
jgi:hypothetical protein